MNKTLVFLTYQYPYFPGEYFIESEIQHLADSFDRVLIFPDRTQWWRSNQLARPLPKGVEYCNILDVSFWRRCWWILLAFFQVLPLTLLRKGAWPGEKRTEAASFFACCRSNFKLYAAKCSLTWMLKKHEAEGAVAYAYWRLESAAAAALLKKNSSLSALYVRCHRCDIYCLKRFPYECLVHEHADGVFPVSDDGKDYLVHEKGLSPNNIQVERLGVNIPTRPGLGSEDGLFRIVSCSSIIPVKRVQFIAEVIGKLRIPSLWTHIGDGPDLKQVEAVIARYPRHIKTQFFGRISNEEVLAHYQNEPVDLFINLSESEGVPVSIMEALSYGTAVVATNVGGSSEIIDTHFGRVVEVDSNADVISALIEEVFADTSTRDSMRSAARKKAEDLCSAKANYQGFAHMLRYGK